MFDIVLESIRLVILLFIVILINRYSKKHVNKDHQAWKLIEIGFFFILIGSVLDITDNFDSLNRYIIIGDTPTQAFLEKVVGYLGGFSFIALGLYRLEESLRISQQRLVLHREQSPIGVIDWNTDFEFLDWNPAAERIFGFTKEEVAGSHITKNILPESAKPAVDKVWKDLLANSGGYYSLNENITKDGRTILCEWHNTPLIDNVGNVIGVTSLVEDVTERQKNEENLRHSQKMDAMDKLTGGVAHDFNNMLGVILGFSELLKNRMGDSDPKQIKYCDEIHNAAERAKKLTSKLLEFSRKTPSSVEITDIKKRGFNSEVQRRKFQFL